MVAITLLSVSVPMAVRAYYAPIDQSASIDIFDKGDTSCRMSLFSFMPKAFSLPESPTIGGLNFLALTLSFLFGFFSHDNDKDYDKSYSGCGRPSKNLIGRWLNMN